MNLFQRIHNAYQTGGVNEIIRKFFFHVIYRLNGKKIRRQILKADLQFGLNTDHEREEQIIISLTTYPKRFQGLELCLKSLLLQTVKPDKIIVYLGKDSVQAPFLNEIFKYKKYGVDFFIDSDKNLRSHKKYYYAFQQYSDAVIITVDDDVIYPKDLVESLINVHNKYPTAICARRVHLMKRINDNELAPYNLWIDQYRKLKEPSHSLFATGNSGVLYPPHCLDQRVLTEDVFTNICFPADDIWLKCMAFVHNTPVVWVPNWEVELPEICNQNDIALSEDNIGQNKNDIYLNNVMDYLSIESKQFFY